MDANKKKRYPYAAARNFFTRELKKEERKWRNFISQCEQVVERMESHLSDMDPDERYYSIYQNTIDDLRQSIQNAATELESVQRNIESLAHLR